ncbi:MAG TPA: hypothetical protein VMU34_15565 [Mycobacterium sp.]|nr:hypothetical protein [Mycobacterium sp.]
MTTAHCPGCHETFTGRHAFEAHRIGHCENGTRRCAHPTDAGLVDAGRGYPCWGSPATDGRFADYRRRTPRSGPVQLGTDSPAAPTAVERT